MNDLKYQFKNLIQNFIYISGILFFFPVFANYLVLSEEKIVLKYLNPLKSEIQFCRQKENFIFGKNPSKDCKNFSGNLDSIFESFEISSEEVGETQWAFYDYLGRQIFPILTIEGHEFEYELLSFVRSKRGQIGIQIQRKKDGLYFFYRINWENIRWE